MAIGLGKLSEDDLKKEQKRIEKMCQSGSKGINSIRFTKDEIKELKETADKLKDKETTNIKEAVEAIYAFAAARDSKLCTCSRKYARAVGLQNKVAGVYERWLVLSNIAEPD